MEQKEWGKPNLELGKEKFDVHKVTSLDNEDANQRPFASVFRPNGVKQYEKIEGKKNRLPRKEKKRLLKYLRNEFPIMFNLMRDFHGGRTLALCLKEKINQYNKMKYGNKTK